MNPHESVTAGRQKQSAFGTINQADAAAIGMADQYEGPAGDQAIKNMPGIEYR